jgi:transcriptional regulator with XRE-family HTH domain
MSSTETMGERIRRLRQERGMSLAKVSGGDFSRAFLNQVELGRNQPSTRVLRVIANRLGTEVDYLLDGRLPGVERELALERARVLIARGDARRALAALGPAIDSSEWPLAADVLLCRAEALRMLGRHDEAETVTSKARELIAAHSDDHRMRRLRAVEKGARLSYGRGDPDSAIKAHLRLADAAHRAGNTSDELEHYRAARVLLEVSGGS